LASESSQVTALLLLLARRGITSYERLSSALALVNKVKITSQKEVITANVENHAVKIGLDGSYSCTCADFIYRKKLCKHIIATLIEAKPSVSIKALEAIVQQKPKVEMTISTGIKELDSFAPIPIGVVGIIGPSKIGKTLLVTQMLYKISNDAKKPALYVDTEGFYTPEAISKSEEIFGKRYGKDARVEFIQIKTLESLLNFLGLSISIEAKEKKVDVTVNFVTSAEDTPIMRIAQFLDISALAIDSFTMPIKRVFGSGTQNLPARAALINGMFARLEEISATLDIPIFVTHHVGKSPINPYDPYKPYGGSALLYNLKHILLVLPGKDAEERRIVRYAWPYLPRDEISLYLVKDYGYVGSEEYSKHSSKAE